MFISNKNITIRDLAAYCGGKELFTDQYEIVDWDTSAHYRYNPSTKKVLLGGDNWGTLENLLDKEIIEMGMANGVFRICV